MSSPRFLVLSLGNPGRYYDTLHSAGHAALNSVQKELHGSQPAFTTQRYGARASQASMGSRYFLIQSPTLMNVSGPWVARTWKDVLEEKNLVPSQLCLVLVHDDLEEELGVVKFRKWHQSHRGHNGVKSVNASLRAQNFEGSRWARISIGIGRPDERDRTTISDYVLQPLNRHQKTVLQRVGPSVVDCLSRLETQWGEGSQA